MNAITPPLNGITATATTTTSTVFLPPIEAGSTQYPMRVRIAASAPVAIRIYGDATSNSMLIAPGDAAIVKTYGCTTVSMQALSGTARVNIQAIPDAFWLPGFVPYNPATQFAGGQQGAWYDPSDYATLFQDSAGTTPVTVVAQPAGLMLDKRLGLVRGPEKVVNSGFDTDTIWTKSDASVTISGGKLRLLNSNNANPAAFQNITPVAGEIYEITLVITDYVSGSINTVIYGTSATSSASFSANGTYTYKLASSTTPNGNLGITCGPTTTLNVDLVSVKVITGNHISQGTAASRPLIGTASGVQYLTFDGIDDGLSTGAITLSADMDCFIAVRRNTLAKTVLMSKQSNNYFMHMEVDVANPCYSGVGIPTFAVNGLNVAALAGSLSTAVPVGMWNVVEARNLNLAGLLNIGISVFTGYNLNGDIGGIILCPAGDAAARQKNRQYLGNKVGLTLP